MFIKVAFIVNFMTFFTLSTSTWFITGCNLTYIPLITWKVVFIRESFHSTIFKQFLTERSALKKTKKLWNLHGLILERLVRKKKWQRNKLTCDVSRPCGARKNKWNAELFDSLFAISVLCFHKGKYQSYILSLKFFSDNMDVTSWVN